MDFIIQFTGSFGKLIIQSYYAAVTYIDDLIGKLIDHLEILSLRRNTTIILTSDHGQLRYFIAKL